ncbi:MAG: hypothetical protein VX642_02955 [Bdellovibrionota bacterium]|nr:hypothetical protein [Bdellovibrionota bacterium]
MFLIIFSISLLSRAEEQNPYSGYSCSIGAAELGDIKEFVMCQQESSAYACGALGLIATGKAVSHITRKKMAEEILEKGNKRASLDAKRVYQSMLDEADKLRKKIADYMIANGTDNIPASVLERLAMQEVNGTETLRSQTPEFKKNAAMTKEAFDKAKRELFSIDTELNKMGARNSMFAYKPFEELASTAKLKLEASVKAVYAKIADLVKSGVPLRKISLDQLTEASDGKLSKSILAKALSRLQRAARFKSYKSFGKWMTGLRSSIGVKSLSSAKGRKLLSKAKAAGKSLTKATGKVVGKAGGKAGLAVLGGYVGLGLALLTEAIPGGHCESTMDDSYFHREAFLGKCYNEPKLEADTLEFLDLSEERQEKILKNKDICAYYEALHESMFKNVQPFDLQCNPPYTIIDVKRGGDQEQRLKIRSDIIGNIISFEARDKVMTGNGLGSVDRRMEFNSQNEETTNNEYMAKDYKSLQLLGQEAVRCCQAPEEDLCIQSFKMEKKSSIKTENSHKAR